MTDNLHTVWMYGALLGLKCNACDHRAVLDEKTLPTIRRANMTRLRDLTLKCKSCGASGRGAEFWSMALPQDLEEAKRFLSGHDGARWANV